MHGRRHREEQEQYAQDHRPGTRSAAIEAGKAHPDLKDTRDKKRRRCDGRGGQRGCQRVEQGKLEIITTEGWRTLIPVLGVRACQP